MSSVDVILTSFNRFDLLRRTLDSFLKFNTYPNLCRFLIIDDYGFGRRTPEQKAECEALKEEYGPLIEVWFNDARRGQILTLDTLWQATTSPYVFCMEDDWEFYRGGFIEESIQFLEQHPSCVQLWLREVWDTNQHPIEPHDGVLKLKLNHNGIWNGFSFNPGLKRRADYNKIGGYSRHTTFIPHRPWESEVAIGRLYAKMGYWAAVSPHGFVKHIGDGRGIRK